MSWYDDFIDWASGSGSDDALSGIGSDVTVDDIVSGTGSVLDTNDYLSNNGSPMYGLDVEKETTNSYDGYTTGEGYTNGDNDIVASDQPKSLSAKEVGDDKGLFGQATDFVDKNKKLTDMGLGLIGGMYNSSQKKKEDNKAYERMLEKRAYDEKIQKEKEDRADARRGGGGGSSAMEMLAAKDALEQAKNARFSASITGLQPSGIINKSKKLTYVGGKPVYTDSGNLT